MKVEEMVSLERKTKTTTSGQVIQELRNEHNIGFQPNRGKVKFLDKNNNERNRFFEGFPRQLILPLPLKIIAAQNFHCLSYKLNSLFN